MKSFNWLFVVQNFEVREFKESAANIEIIEPLIESGYVNESHILTFSRHNADFYQSIVSNKVKEIKERVFNAPIAIYGAGVHTQQYFSEFNKLNIVAIVDRDQNLWGEKIENVPIISLEQLSDYSEHVLISSKAFEDAIECTLRTKNKNLQIETIYQDFDDKDRFEKNMYQSINLALFNNEIDIVFFSPTHPNDCLSVQYWEKIKAQHPNVKFVTLWWDYDEDEEASGYIAFERDCLKWNDLCIENSNGTRLNAMRKKLAPYDKHTNTHRVEFLPTIFTKRLFHPSISSDKKYDIAIFGSSAGQRKVYIEKLKQRYGDRFWHLGGINHKTQKSMLNIQEYAEAVRQTRLFINTQTYPFRLQCKGKVREALGCEVLLLEEDNSETRLLLNDEQGVVYFKDFEELVDKIEWLINDEIAQERIVKGGSVVWKKIGNSKRWASRIISRVYD